MLIDALRSTGLSSYEAQTYLALSELGESTAGPLSKKSGVPTSHLYRVLETLQEQGLISTKTKNKTKIFMIGPEAALYNLLEQRKHELKEHEHELRKALPAVRLRPKQETVSDYQYYEGIRGIKALFETINEHMKPNSEAVVLSARVETWEKLEAFLQEHHRIRVKKNVHEKMILPATGKHAAKPRKDIGKIEIRYLDHDNQAEYGVFGELVAILYHGSKTPRGFLIHDTAFAETFRTIFYLLWEHARPQ